MARAQDDSGTLRFGRRESARLVAALVISLLVHLCIWEVYHVGQKAGLWKKVHPPAWLQLTQKKHAAPPPQPHNDEPTTFVDVSHADADAPVKPKYYSYRNSHAANPIEGNANVPEIIGKQTQVPKTEDVAKVVKKSENTEKSENSPQTSKAQPLMPSPSTAPTEAQQTPGETELLKNKNTTDKSLTKAAQPQQDRPRTIRDALAQRNQLPGQMMQQAGGVSRHAQFTALDAKATPFGEYDRAIVEAVTQRWYDLLDSHHYSDDRNGRVTVQFKLMSDGAVIEVRILENTVGENWGYTCVDAIEDAAPFAKWPSDMMREIGANFREVTFTFYYY